MKLLRRGCALILSALMCLTLLSACGEDSQSGAAETLSLSVGLGGPMETLDPIRAESMQDETVLAHLYENLMRTSTDASGETSVTAGMAKSYRTETNYDGTVTYTFRLRSAKWSDGQSVTAGDFVYAWQRLADPASASPLAALLSVVAGYDEVRSTGDVSKLQVTAKNDSTLSVVLKGECDWFLSDVCTATATVPLRQDVVKKLKEAAKALNASASAGAAAATWCSDPGKLVTNGPYRVSQYSGENLTLTASGTYTGGSSGPGTIQITFARDAAAAWALYESGTVDFTAPLPEEQLQKLAADKNWSATPEVNTCVLLFNTARDPFSDPTARQAFSLSIDRSALASAASAAASPATGLVPGGVPGDGEEDFRTNGGELVDCDPDHYTDSCADAQDQLSQAGYSDGQSFPAVELLYDNTTAAATAAAQTLAQMWARQLRVTVKPVGLTAEKLESALASGDFDLAVTNLRGYANDAESFLAPWGSKSESNVVGYRNSAYDTLLNVIDNASDKKARLGCLHDAESLLLQDCPLTPLYFTGTAWELRDTLSGISRDARGWFSFSSVYSVKGQ